MRCIYTNVARDKDGDIINDATVTVYLAGSSTLASIYNSLAGTTATNSVTTNSKGEFTFYVDRFDYDSDQKFKYSVVKTNYDTKTYDYIDIDRVVTGTYTISADTTVTTHINVPKGVIYSIDSGKTLTINGTIVAGPYQIFSGSGTVTGLKESYPEWWGIDGTADDVQINQAIAAVTAERGTVELQDGTDYDITATVALASNVSLFCKSKAGARLIISANVWGITGTTVENLVIKNIYIGNSTASLGGILLQTNSQRVSIYDVEVRGDTAGDGTAVMVDGIKIDASYWIDLYSTQAWYTTGKGLWLHDANATSASNMFLGRSGYPLYIDSSTNCSIIRPTVDGSTITTTGIYVTGQCYGTVLVTPRSEGNGSTGTGIHFNGATDIHILGGIISEFETASLHFAGATKNCTVSGMYIDNTTGNIIFEANNRMNTLEDSTITSITNITWAGARNAIRRCRYSSEETVRDISTEGDTITYYAGNTDALVLDAFTGTVVVGALSGDKSITLPSATAVPRGKEITVKLGGAANAHTITIYCVSGEKIETTTDGTIALDEDYESVTVRSYNEDRWYIVSSYLYP